MIVMKLDERKILIISSAAFLIILFIAILVSSELVLAGNLVFFGLLMLLLPYSIYRFFQFKRIREYEKEFPNFLRDLAESQRAGLTLVESIKLTGKANYGTLSIEVKKMIDQLSWNITLEKVIKDFSKRTRASKIITRSLLIIEQANKSGGDIDDTMDSLANNIESLKDVQEEKSTLLNQQLMMMYAIFFIFLGITIVLIRFLIPMLQTNVQAQAGVGVPGFSMVEGFSANPCEPCMSSETAMPECIGCTLFLTTASIFGFGGPDSPAGYYKALFFVMIIVQGVFSGLLAGQIASDSIAGGIKHSLIMLVSGVMIFIFVVRIGII